MLDDLKIFITAANKNSLTAAAQHLDMTIATVSRRISALEQKLGCELLHRSTKGLTLTPVGESYYRECAEFIDALDQRISNLDQTLNSLKGDLKVLAPVNLGSGPLDAFWQGFVQLYPDIELNIELSNTLQDIRDTRADIALRSGNQPSSSLIQKKLGHIEPILVASPNMAFPLPKTIEDLQHAPSIASNMFADWLLINNQEDRRPLNKEHRHISNDMTITLNLAKAGAGIALIPMSMVHGALETGELIRVLPEWRGQNREIFLVWPYRRSLSARAKLLKEEMTKFLHQQTWFHPSP
ncbi:LysR family transcriptional regulator [Marinomonas sp. UCMA 3892]|uniref:LysR family transcriptional regulator n=1 Tax=Marinomonas sp. UCMA 3892 TaxID=1972585 RepID=UPI00146C5F46|nr:LysR family transcriptional regulator [Marinomonas sp. UCMA 3892]NLU97736.1 LysR family transcriptional regulator [Marinomonas sp. UCMA 3892]